MKANRLWGNNCAVYFRTQHKPLTKLLIILLSAGAFYFAAEYWCFSWLALVCLCIYALRNSFIVTFTIGLFSFLLGASNPHAVLPLVVYWPLILTEAALFAGVLAVFGRLGSKWRGWDTGFVFASGLMAQEFLLSLYSPHGTVHSLAYTQAASLPLVQIASVTGIWGITFLLGLISATLALVITYPEQRRLGVRTNLLPLGVLLLVLCFGMYRLFAPMEGQSIRIGIAAVSTSLPDYIATAEKHDPRLVEATLAGYRQKVVFLANSGAQVVVLPEKIITLEANDDNFRQLSDMAKQNQVQLVAGVIRQDGGKLYNSVYVFSPAGENLLIYNKQHLLPAFEKRYTAGDELQMTDKKGMAICKDMDFTFPALEYSRQGAQLLFVPALDFHDDGWSHARVAILRGIEGNYAVVRAGQWGYLTFSDSKGQVIGQVSVDKGVDGAVLFGEVPAGGGISVYSRIGNIFAWGTSVFFLAGSVLLSCNKPR